ncbi:class I SAM-dependent methyltransferase [Alkalicoccus luteus]|uniref:Class I SAM-dependent methyltransferase n=1 Tax=Alkalicoccus luteus TaxID=1237094 RepID=A0A969PRF4_9BACI|nr:class I SAM-dependent methyltransferase [Alkalicoccus luteus]NJP36169.1 class I SAM-dependent methyltransferase [Alkalicoccus luteus]
MPINPYDDPTFYDRRYDHIQMEAELLKGVIREGSVVIDLACGTGRTTLPLAQAGAIVTGIDINQRMLGRAVEKAEAAGIKASFIQQDAASFSLPLHADFIIMTGHSFQHLLTEVEHNSLLAAAFRHLKPGGSLYFDTRTPPGSGTETQIDETSGTREVDTYDSQTGMLVSSLYDADERLIESLTIRYTEPEKLRPLLEKNGFTDVQLRQHWSSKPYTGTGTIVVYAQKQIRKGVLT